MGLNQKFAGGMVAILVAVSSPLSLVRTASASPPQLAQITPNTVTGQLDENSETFEDGSYYNVHFLEGVAGENIRIDLISEDFDTYLILLDPEGVTISQSDDSGTGTNARIAMTLPKTGTYYIVASAYSIDEERNATGKYTLSLQLATSDEIVQHNYISQAESLNHEMFQLVESGRLIEAIPLADQILSIYHEYAEENLPNVAAIFSELAQTYNEQGFYTEAEYLYKQALAIRQSSLGTNHSLVAISLNNLAELYRDLGRYSEAKMLYEQALEIFQNALSTDHEYVGTSLNNLALLYQAQGRYDEAEILYQQALEIFQNAFDSDHPEVAKVLDNMAELYRNQGRYDEAEILYQQALEIFQNAFGLDHIDVAINLNNLALLYSSQGLYVQAETFQKQALEIFQIILRPNHPLIATNLNNLASLNHIQSRHSEAEVFYLQALEIRQADLGADHPSVATSLNNLASLYEDQNLYEEAEAYYRQALEIFRTTKGPNHPDVASIFNNLAHLYLAQGDFTQSVHHFSSSVQIEEQNLVLNMDALTETQRQAYISTLVGTTSAAVFLSLQTKDALSLGLETLLRRKGRVLEAGRTSFERFRQKFTLEDEALLDDFVALRRQLVTLTFNPPANLSPEQYRARLIEIETEANRLEKTLSQRSAAFRVDIQSVDVATVQAQIPTNAVLVEYVRYRPFDAQADRANRFGFPRYAAYLLFPNGRIEVMDLGDAAEIDAAVQSFVGLLQNRSAQFQRSAPVPTIREAEVEQVTGNIKELVFDPIAPYLQDTDHLLISPDGQLNLLPFEALQTEAGGEYLVQQYQISYLNSGRDLLKFDVIEPSQNPAVIVANPDYENASNSPLPDLGEGPGSVDAERLPEGWASRPSTPLRTRSLSGVVGAAAPEGLTNRRSTELSQLQVGPLPGTAAEAEAIRPLLPQAIFLTEADATENQIKSVQAPRILHIATHGFFLPDVELPEPSDLGSGLIASNDPLASSGRRGLVTENPLLRSGLALAGFNTRSSGNEDGVFTALEASQLNLFGTQLVVLSACETGLGEVANGEGVYGLRRAFALAGAETQLMSLWNVSDYGTQSLMARYYENLTAGMGRSEALRAVQLEMIEQGGEYSHPYYWAAFILAGDWRPME